MRPTAMKGRSRMADVIEIDGSAGEGGGVLARFGALYVSCARVNHFNGGRVRQGYGGYSLRALAYLSWLVPIANIKG